MTCALNFGITADFLESRIRLHPNEANTRSSHKEFSYTKIQVSREAGERVASNAVAYEPVHLRFDDEIQDRYMFHPEAVSLEQSGATITLYDAEKILERGSVSKHFQNSTIGDVIEYLVNSAEDPNNVIAGVVHPEPYLSDQRVRNNSGEVGGGWIGGAWGLVAQNLPIIEAHNGDIKFEETNPQAAMKKAAKQFNIETWVDRDGSFRYGLRGGNTSEYVVGPKSKEIRLREYNVSIGSGQVTKVLLRGDYDWSEQPGIGDTDLGFRPNDVYAYGEAILVDDSGERIPGRTASPDRLISGTTPAQVEQMARRALIQHYMERKSGNIVINAGASTAKRRLARIAVGDLIGARGEISDECTRSVDTGIFHVNSIKHRLDTRRGWTITIEVAGLPEHNISSTSWYYDTNQDTRWETLDSRQNTNDN